MSDDERERESPSAAKSGHEKWPLLFMGLAILGLLLLMVDSGKRRYRSPEVSGTSRHQNVQEPAANSAELDNWANGFSQSSVKIAQKILPTVVSIRIVREDLATDDEELAMYFGQLPRPKSSDTGSGFFVRPDGWVVTNYHVVRQAKKIEVMEADGAKYLAKMETFDAVTDIALLKIDAKNRPWLGWARQPPTTGSLVWVAGSPFGLDGSLSMGIVSAIHRNSLSGSPMRDYLQTDAVVNPGQSGGPVVNAEGEVIGIASVILGEEYRGIGFALPSSMAEAIVDQLIGGGSVVRGWIGAQFGQVTAERARRSGIDDLQGAYVERLAGSTGKPVPAEQAGLRVGDICLSINDRSIQSQFDLGRSIAMLNPGDVARLKIVRNAQSLTIEIVVGEKP